LFARYLSRIREQKPVQNPAQNSEQPTFSPKALRRIIYALSLIASVMVVGIVGFHYIEGMDYVNALYFESMLATGQGPPLTLTTDNGKVFASIMAFVSVGSILTTIVYTLGPVLSSIWREGLERVEKEARTVEKDIEGKNGKPED
jgi:hypothetical protein